MDIPKKLKEEIWEYCKLNNISNIDKFTIKMTQQGFTVEKFGATPFGTGVGEVKEVVKIVEVPVEKIVERVVEKIIEVPVEKIVEKEIYITDDDEVKELSDKNIELNKKIKELKNKLEDNTKDSLIDELNKKIKEMNKSNTKSKDKVSNLEKELKELKEKLETLEKDTKKGDDIYNDGRKGGWFGSNLLKR
jgi:predicted RNase H-like nuclease (RuvC/YqgF family)